MVRQVLCIAAVAALLAGCSSSRSKHVIAGQPASSTTTPADAVVDAGQSSGGPPVSAGGAASAPSATRGRTAAAPYVPVGAPRRLPPAPRYTHLRIHVDTDADWMTVS